METLYKAGEGEPMVLLHGFTAAGAPGCRFCRRWSGTRCWPRRCREHHGGLPFAPGAAASIAAMADAVERLMDAEGIERAHLVGSSLGGWLSLELALRGRGLSVVGICPAGGWEVGGPEERSVVRFFRRSATTVRLIRPCWKTIARRPRLRAIALGDMVAYPSHLSADAALTALEAAGNCTIVDEMVALAKILTANEAA